MVTIELTDEEFHLVIFELSRSGYEMAHELSYALTTKHGEPWLDEDESDSPEGVE